jgi:hypothetical protein
MRKCCWKLKYLTLRLDSDHAFPNSVVALQRILVKVTEKTNVRFVRPLHLPRSKMTTVQSVILHLIEKHIN